MDFSVVNFKNKWIYMEAGLALLLFLLAAVFGPAADKKASEDRQAMAAQENLAAEQTARRSGETAEEEADSDTKGKSGNESADDGGDSGSQEVIAPGQYPIMGSAQVTTDQMTAFFAAAGVDYPSEELADGGAPDIETFCQIYYEEAAAEGVRPEVAFVQTMKETNWLQFGGDARIEQYNFAGLGTTGGGVEGESFSDVRTGVRAQIQHLKAYASEDALEQECVDTRYAYVTKGCAPYVEWLGQNENPKGYGWATDEAYGYSIVEMINDLKTY